MVSNNAAASSIENDDCVETRLKEAAANDSGQLLLEFLRAFSLEESEVAITDRQPSVISDPELEEVTFKGHSDSER